MMENMAKSLMVFYRRKRFQNSTAVGGHRTDSRLKTLTGMKFLICILIMNPMQTGTGMDSGIRVNILMTLIIAEAGQVQRLR